MARTRLSSKGQVVLPKEIRERLYWGKGTELEADVEGQAVVLRPVAVGGCTTLDDLVGCIAYEGPPVTLAEMDAGVESAARKMWRMDARSSDTR